MDGYTTIKDSTRKGLTPRETLIYGDIVRLSKNDKGYCWAKNEELANLAGCSISTVAHTISKLKAKGYITIENATSFTRQLKPALQKTLQGTMQDVAHYHAKSCTLPCKDLQGTMQDVAYIDIEEKYKENKEENTRGDEHTQEFNPDVLLDDSSDFDAARKVTQIGEQARQTLEAAGLKVPNQLVWMQREWMWCLDAGRQLKLTPQDVAKTLANYATLIKAIKANPQAYWWTATLPVTSLFRQNGRAPPAMRFLPDVFNLEDFKKGTQAGGVNTAQYDMKEIANRQGD